MTVKTYAEIAKEYKFSVTYVTEEEHEDGIGATAGINFVKDQVFYRPMDFAKDLNKEIKFGHAKIEAQNIDDLKKQVINWAEQNNIEALNFDSIYEYAPGQYFAQFQYIK